MNSFEVFTRLIPYRLRRISHQLISGKIRGGSKVLEPVFWITGAPQGLDQDHLETICCERFGGSIVQVQHSHLSGWKENGAYRLKVDLTNGSEYQFVYKIALYHVQQIPALSGFPALPGPPEYEIYQKGRTHLGDILPEIFYIDEVIPGKEYRYLFENLSLRNTFAETPELKLKVVAVLPKIHRTLSRLKDQVDLSNLLEYNRAFSLALQEYARESLEVYRKISPFPELEKLFEQWQKITEVHSRKELFEILEPVLIHGDLNFSNVFLQRDNPSIVRMVDWEWAGMGFPHADLAALLKGTPAPVEDVAVRMYASAYPQVSLDQHRLLYTWCQLERNLNDAAFLATQLINSEHETSLNIPRAVRTSVSRVLSMYNRLVKLGTVK